MHEQRKNIRCHSQRNPALVRARFAERPMTDAALHGSKYVNLLWKPRKRSPKFVVAVQRAVLRARAQAVVLSRKGTSAVDMKCTDQILRVPSSGQFREECEQENSRATEALSRFQFRDGGRQRDNIRPPVDSNFVHRSKRFSTIACGLLDEVDQPLPSITIRILNFRMNFEVLATDRFRIAN